MSKDLDFLDKVLEYQSKLDWSLKALDSFRSETYVHSRGSEELLEGIRFLEKAMNQLSYRYTILAIVKAKNGIVGNNYV